jgi:hypothetical protein
MDGAYPPPAWRLDGDIDQVMASPTFCDMAFHCRAKEPLCVSDARHSVSDSALLQTSFETKKSAEKDMSNSTPQSASTKLSGRCLSKAKVFWLGMDLEFFHLPNYSVSWDESNGIYVWGILNFPLEILTNCTG